MSRIRIPDIYLWCPEAAVIEVRREPRGGHVQELVVVGNILPQPREYHRYVRYRFLYK